MNRISKSTKKRRVVLMLCATLASDIAIADVEYELRVGASRSDNIARSDTFEVDATIALLGLQLDASHESRRVEANIITDLEYRNYVDDVFDNEVVGSLDANLELKIAPGVFSWVFEDRFGNLQTNPFQATTPINRQNINRFSTGPDFRLRLGSKSAIEVGSRFSTTRFEVSDIDNDVFGGSISLIRALSPRRSISLNATTDRIEYDNTVLNSNYDRQSAYFGFESEISRGSLVVNLGYNELHDSGAVAEGNLINIILSRELSRSTTFLLSYDEGFTDPSDTLGGARSNPNQGIGDPQNTPGVSDPFESKKFSAELSYARNNNTFFVSALYNEDEYLTVSVLDRDRSELRAGFSTVLGSAWRMRLSAGLLGTDFDATGRKDDDTVFGAGLSRQLSRTISINLDFTRFDRDSSDSIFDYVENIVSLTFSYARR